MAVLFLLSQPERDLLQGNSLALARREFGVKFLSGAADLSAAFTEGPASLLFLDADLPDFRDLNILASLQRIPGWEKVPILVCASGDLAAEAKRSGAADFLSKPLVPEKVFERMAAMMSSPLRKYPRKVVTGPCLVLAAGRRLEAKLIDVSISGIRTKLDAPLSTGALVQLSFGIPAGQRDHIVRCKGKVARAIAGGYGFAFSSMDPNDRAVLYSFTRSG